MTTLEKRMALMARYGLRLPPGDLFGERHDVRLVKMGCTRGFPAGLRKSITAEARKAVKGCKDGKRTPLLRALAERHGLHVTTVARWLREKK